MKRIVTMLSIALGLMSTTAIAQTTLKELKAGNIFYVSIPNYMSRTTGLNSSSTIQYKSAVKDVYGFVIEDPKEDLVLADLQFSSINEFYERFIADFLKNEGKRQVSKPVYQQKGGINFAECDFTYYDKDVEGEIYYLVGIVETKVSFYKVLSWTTAANKDKYKADFQKILYSLKD
ncbi:hypothetical protein [Pedobacter immunditicola]|uniref:hypothetical protein n=1 Tax=Pedobacter immunditicola TaxID=3133440 RepID=UPI00309A814D